MAILGYLPKIKRSLGLAFGAHSAWLSHKNVPYLIIRREDRNTKIWISREWKELFRWNKKHLSYFLKSYHLVRNKILIRNSRQALNFLVAIDWESFQQNLPFPVNLRSNLDSFFILLYANNMHNVLFTWNNVARCSFFMFNISLLFFLVTYTKKSFFFWCILFQSDTTSFKACVCYFLSSCYFTQNDSPSNTMKNFFYFILAALFVVEIFKFLYFYYSLFFLLSAVASDDDQKQILKFMTSSTVRVRTW